MSLDSDRGLVVMAKLDMCQLFTGHHTGKDLIFKRMRLLSAEARPHMHVRAG